MTDHLFELPDGPRSSATFSDCGRYRYHLARRWRDSGKTATFVMLNPSTADATLDDPTIRRCIGFARDWGLDGLTVVNLYAYRATDPRELWTQADPVGPENDQAILAAAMTAYWHQTPLVAAWGAHARPERVAEVLRATRHAAWLALGLTKDGAPRHPLYLPRTAEPFTWPG